MYSLNLNTTSRQELYERACARMAQLIPGWNDAIPSDPAVVLLELFSYLSAVQNREIDTLREGHYLACLKLLEEAPRRLTPARLLAVPAQGGPLWPGLRFDIDGVPFEVLDAPQSGECQVREVSLAQNASRTALQKDAPLVVSHDPPAALEFTLSAPLVSGAPAKLWLELQPEPGRNPPDRETPPPATLLAQMWDGEAWRDVPCGDGTCGLLQSGYVTLTPPGASNRLRLLIHGEVEGEPRISAAALHPIVLEQRRTRSQCIDLEPPYRLPQGWAENWLLRFFLPENDGWREDTSLFVRDGCVCGLSGEPHTVRVAAAEPGFAALHSLRELPGETIRMEEDGILPESLRLMIEEDGVWHDCPVRPPEDGRTLPKGCRWDGARKALRFGDGRDFCVPRTGRLLVTGCVCTLGAKGNGAGGLMERDGTALLPLGPAGAGQDAEDGKSAFFRAAKEQERPMRAVSLSDYEALAMRAPGLALARVKAVPAAQLGGTGPGVVVLAKPRSADPLPPLTRWQRERLTFWLERFRLIGVPLEVRGPRYCPIEVRVHARFTAPAAEPFLRAAALRHTDGVTGPLDFGAELSYTALFSALGAVPGVGAVRALELRALSGGGRRTQEGGIKLDADALPYLERFQVTAE